MTHTNKWATRIETWAGWPLHHIALQRTILHCTTPLYSTLHYTALHHTPHNTMTQWIQYTTPGRIMHQHNTTQHNTTRHDTTHHLVRVPSRSLDRWLRWRGHFLITSALLSSGRLRKYDWGGSQFPMKCRCWTLKASLCSIVMWW